MIKKICCVDEDGRFGGPQVRMLEIYEKIDRKKFHFYFVIPKNIKIFKKKLKKLDAKIVEFKITRLTSDLKTLIKYILFFPYEIYSLTKFFKKEKFDIIQSNGVPHFKSIIAARILNIKSIWIVEDTYSPKIIISLFQLVSKITNSKIIYISKKVYEYYIKNSKINMKNTFEIMSPTDSEYFKRGKTYKNKKNITITTVSGIIPVKGVEDFLETAEKVLSKEKNVKFQFVGKNIDTQKNYYEKIKNIYDSKKENIKKRIIFLGMSNNVKKILENSDIFLCTSKSEGGPIAVWEAMSMEIPVVSTKVGGTVQYIKNNHNGYLSNIGNTDSLAKNTLDLVKNFKKRKKFGKLSRKIVKIKLDSKVISKKYTQIYESV